MATTQYGVNHPNAVKLWRKMLYQEALKQTWASKFMGKDSNSLIQELDETSKGPGDRVRIILRMLLSGAGVQGDSTLEGSEEALTTYSDDVLIDQLRHGVRSVGRMSEQRVPFSVRDEGLAGLKDWYADKIDTGFANHICGNTAQTDTRYTGNNATIAPTATTRWIFSDDNTVETTLTSGSSDQMVLSLIDTAVAKAKTATPQIRPINVSGDQFYVCFLDTWQAKNMKTNYGTGGWGDIQKAAMSGGDVSKNPIFTGALGVHSGVVLHETTRAYTPTSDGGTRLARAVLCGAQAVALAYGQDAQQGSDRMSWVEELFDFGNQLGIGVGMIWGMKKTVFNSTDFGTVVISTNAVAA